MYYVICAKYVVCAYTWMCMDIYVVCTCMYVVHVCMTVLADQWHSKMTGRDHLMGANIFGRQYST